MARKRGVIKWVDESRSWCNNHWVGYIGEVKAFSIEAIGMVDLRNYSDTKHYKPTKCNSDPVEELKQIATDIILGVNLETHDANWMRQRDRSNKSISVIQKADELLRKIEAGEPLNLPKTSWSKE